MRLCCCEWISVGDITARIGVAQPTVSHHLAILRDAGL
ncbi:MAG: ArsR family transcriptional regulator, partial [Chloroflexi bacterium]|nr:ArsR family transcriptional regulator [Chloroflexota bacterium]